jgi:putative phosphotransacetylase
LANDRQHNPPVRESGDLRDSPGCKIIGPHGEIEIAEGVIIAQRHLHINVKEAAELGIVDKEKVCIKIGGTGCGLIFDDVIARTHPTIKRTVHIDTDEANAAGLSGGTYGVIIGNWQSRIG